MERHIRRSSPGSDRGFTLIELVMTLLLIAILAAVAIPRAPAPALSVRAQADQLASDIRYVQTLSMTRGQRFCARLTVAGYSLGTTASNCAAGVEHPAGLAMPVVVRAATLAWADLPGALVAFDGVGAPFTDTLPTPTPLANSAVITVAGGGVSNTITVSPATGHVAVGP